MTDVIDPLLDDGERHLNDFFGGRLVDDPRNDVLDEMKKFVHSHGKKLRKIEEDFIESNTKPWDKPRDLWAFKFETYENMRNPAFFTKDQTENQLFNKITTIFAVLCDEVDRLERIAEDDFYSQLSMFGVTPEEEEDSDEEEENVKDKPEQLQLDLARILPLLQKLSNFIAQVNKVCFDMVTQMAHLYHPRQQVYSSTFQYVNFDFVLRKLGSLLCISLTLDTIIRENEELTRSWEAYKKMVGFVHNVPEQWGLEKATLRQFEYQLVELQKTVMSGQIYLTCISQPFAYTPNKPEAAQKVVGTNQALYEEIDRYIRFRVKSLQEHLKGKDSLKPTEMEPRTTLTEIYCLYGLFRKIFTIGAKVEKKLYCHLWAFQSSIPLVILGERAVWWPADFLQHYCPYQTRSLNPSPKKIIQTRNNILKELNATFHKQVSKLYVDTCLWMIKFDSEVPISANDPKRMQANLRVETKLMTNGILLANQIYNLLTTAIFLTLNLGQSWKKKNIRSIAVAAELLKSIEYLFHQRSKRIAENVSYMLVIIAQTLQTIFNPLKKKLERLPRPNNIQLDAWAAVTLTMGLLSKAPTKSRFHALNVALSVASLRNMTKSADLKEIRYQMWKLETIVNWQRRLGSVVNCNFMYWIQPLVPTMLNDIFQNSEEVHRLPYLFAALRDPVNMLKSNLADVDNELYQKYKKEMNDVVKEELIQPLCRSVENDLRLHVHSIVLDQQNLKEGIDHSRDMIRFVNLPPFRMIEDVLSIREHVEHHLNVTFYNMATVALHDWQVYAEMRNLAKSKYGLDLVEAHLPSHSHYSEGLDVLVIMRKIHVFVAKFNYNLNTQVFVERSVDQLHLNTINIEHIANSIRTHGTGIMSTTVNFSYQFLSRMFQKCSEFLYDDHIRSRLMKDIRFFRDNKHALDNRYPYQRAIKFNKGIKALGVDDKGMSYLDHFRRLITTVGNVLGYVRMVRSGGLHQCYKSIQFVPDVDDVPSFADKIAEDGLSEQTKNAAENLDSVLKNLLDSFGEETDYFAVLVNVFRPLADKHAHLKNFVAIVPPLTLNFVEHLLSLKERIPKKGGRDEAAFTDDGFALGLAFMLKVLGLMDSFDAYHWWEEVDAEMKKTKKDLDKVRHRRTSEEAETYTLSMKQLTTMKREWELLYFSFEASRVFFRDVQREQEEEEEVKPKQANAEAEKKEETPAITNSADAAPAPVQQQAGPIQADPAPAQPPIQQPAPSQPPPAEPAPAPPQPIQAPPQAAPQQVQEPPEDDSEDWSSEEQSGPRLALPPVAPPELNAAAAEAAGME